MSDKYASGETPEVGDVVRRIHGEGIAPFLPDQEFTVEDISDRFGDVRLSQIPVLLFRRDRFILVRRKPDPLTNLRLWLDDPHRKPPHLAFSAGPEREIADRITTMIEVHCEAVTKRHDPAAELVAAAREAIGDMRQAASLLRANYNFFVAARLEENADSLAAALDAYEQGGAT